MTKNFEKLLKGHIPAGLKPFRCGGGPTEIDEQIGVDLNFFIDIPRT